MLFNLQEYLDEKIPIAGKDMGIKYLSSENGELILKLPLSQNKNDKEIAFAGSIYSVGVLAGWAACQLILEQEKISADIAIYKSECDFFLPVNCDLFARCKLPGKKVAADFLESRRAKVNIEVELFSQEKIYGKFYGKYAIREKHTIK